MPDFHPIVVHFPIALLTLYAVLECVRWRKVMEAMHIFYVKAVLSIFGALGGVVAYMTGPEVHGVRLVEMHEDFATITLITFGIIALSYLSEWFRPNTYSTFLHRPYVIVPLAILGLISVTITGGLGGAIVYGTHFDPFMKPVFELLEVY